MKNRIKTIIFTTAVTSVILSGCGGGSSSYKAEAPAEAYASDNMYMAEAAMEDYDSDYSYEEAAAAVSNGIERVEDSAVENSSRKIIKNVNLSCETEEFDAFISNIEARVNALGGYMESTDISGRSINASKSQKRSANIIARIPSKKLNEFVTDVSEKSNITYKSESADDVTLNYADTEAHIKSLRTEQDRLNELLLQADDIETIIAIESRITDVRYELESYESRLRTIDNKVDYSTVNINVQEVERYTVVEEPEQTVWQRIGQGFNENLIEAVEMLTDFFVGIIVAIPTIIVTLIVVGLPIAFFVWLIMFIVARAKGPEYREEMKAKRAARKAKRAELKAAKKAKKPGASATVKSQALRDGNEQTENQKEV